MAVRRLHQIEILEPRMMLAGDGLLGEYFDNPDLTAPVEQRTDAQVQFPVGFGGSPVDMGDAPPGTSVVADDSWSIRWTGFVKADAAGEWTFHTDSDDGVRLWVGGTQIIDEWNDHTLRRDSGTITLGEGWHPIQLEYYQDTGDAAIQISFEGPDQPEAVIPQSHLSTTLLTGLDIGAVNIPGSTTIDHASGEYTVAGSGSDIFGSSDQFQYAYQAWSGDGEIIARVTSLNNTHPSAKAGVMFRESLDADSTNAVMEIKATSGSEFQYRATTGGNTAFTGTGGVSAPYYVRLVRSGDTFTGYRSTDGQNWIQQGTVNIAMGTEIFVGLSVTSHNNNALNTATFDNVTISPEVQPPVDPPSSGDGTGVTGFISLLNANTFDPLGDDGKGPSTFFTDGDEFYTYRNSNGIAIGYDEDEGKSSSDDDVVFRLTPEGELLILGVPDNGQTEPFGYISTEDSYRNYHLSLEYKWGTEKFAPRDGAVRDSGLLYHVPVAPDGVVWPESVETQIQENDTGDFFFLWSSDRTRGTVTTEPGTNRYQPDGEVRVDNASRIVKSQTVDSLTDWNRVEVIIEDDNVTVVVNGIVVNRASDLKQSQDGLLIPLAEGKIQLQAEGAEILYRNIELKPTHAVGGRGDYKVLVFNETAGFRHTGAIGSAQAAIQGLGDANGFEVDFANDSAGVFTEANLSQYAAVVWNSTTGDVLDETEQAAFESYIESGGGYVGLHAAADTEYDWQWYGDLVGAYFQNHPQQQLATLRLDPEATIGAGGSGLAHPAADALPQEWERFDEWYNYQTNPRADVNVLLTLDEETYNESDGTSAADDHPIAWWHDYQGGRSFYTGLGHRNETYTEPLFLTHLLGGIEYAAGASRVAPADAEVIFDGSTTAGFEKANGGGAVDWQIDDDGNLAIVPGTGDIQTAQSFTDYRLHLEFNVPSTAPGTPEQQRGNSGLYLHNSYELQILDSYGDSNFDDQHAGSIYNVTEAAENAALPADTWQVYDVDFTAPKFDALGNKTANARVTAYLNGVLIHDDVEIAGPTLLGEAESPGPKPFTLQDHDANSNLKFRNIWVQPTSTIELPALPGDYNGNNVVDAADYTVWRDALGSNVDPYSGADGDGDGIIANGDYEVWKQNYGNVLFSPPPPPPTVQLAKSPAVTPAPEAGIPWQINQPPAKPEAFATFGVEPLATIANDTSLLLFAFNDEAAPQETYAEAFALAPEEAEPSKQRSELPNELLATTNLNVEWNR